MEWKALSDALIAMGPAGAPAFPDLVAAIHDYSEAETLVPALASVIHAMPDGEARLRAELADDG